MKRILYFLIIMLVISCKKEPVQNTELENSRRAWVEYKASIKNSYSYTVYFGSVFGGYNETKIEVLGGKVIRRTYISGIYPPNSQILTIKNSWVEDITTLNSHSEGYAGITLDEVYAKAKDEYLAVDRKTNDLFFSADAKSLIASCGYVTKGCMDDCFIGINIKSIDPMIF